MPVAYHVAFLSLWPDGVVPFLQNPLLQPKTNSFQQIYNLHIQKLLRVIRGTANYGHIYSYSAFVLLILFPWTLVCTSIHSNAVLCRPSSLDPSCNIALESVNIIILAYDVSGVKLIGKLVQTYKYVPHLL